MNPYGMPGMLSPDDYARGRAALLERLKDPNVVTTPEQRQSLPTGGGIVYRPPAPSGPYEAPEAHPGAGGVTPDLMKWGSEGPGGFDGHAQDPGRRIVVDPPNVAPPVVNPGGQALPPQAKAYGVTSGYDTGKLNDLNYHSPKYDLGRITNDIGLQALMTPEGQAQLQQKLAANPFFKDVRVKGDKIFYTGQHGQPVTIDYIQGMNSGHPNLNYLTSDTGGAPAAGAPPISTTPISTLPIHTAQPMPGTDSDFFRNLMEKLGNPDTIQKLMEDPRVAQLLQQDPNQMHAMVQPATAAIRRAL